jgi:hypothetical protein
VVANDHSELIQVVERSGRARRMEGVGHMPA